MSQEKITVEQICLLCGHNEKNYFDRCKCGNTEPRNFRLNSLIGVKK